MSVFRYGLVGPNFQPNLLSETKCKKFCLKKGKMVNIPLLLNFGDCKVVTPTFGFVSWLIVELNKLFVFF